MLAVIVTIMKITVSYTCSTNIIVPIMTIKRRYICSDNNYCDNNGEVYVQC